MNTIKTEDLPTTVRAALGCESVSFAGFEGLNSSNGFKSVILVIGAALSGLGGFFGVYRIYQLFVSGKEIQYDSYLSVNASTLSGARPINEGLHLISGNISLNNPVHVIIISIISVILIMTCLLCIACIVISIFSERSAKGKRLGESGTIACIGTPTRLLRIYGSEVVEIPWREFTGRSRILGKSLHLERGASSRGPKYIVVSNLDDPAEVERSCREKIDASR